MLHTWTHFYGIIDKTHSSRWRRGWSLHRHRSMHCVRSLHILNWLTRLNWLKICGRGCVTLWNMNMRLCRNLVLGNWSWVLLHLSWLRYLDSYRYRCGWGSRCRQRDKVDLRNLWRMHTLALNMTGVEVVLEDDLWALSFLVCRPIGLFPIQWCNRHCSRMSIRWDRGRKDLMWSCGKKQGARHPLKWKTSRHFFAFDSANVIFRDVFN